MRAAVIGAGMAGSEAALWLAGRGIEVDLYEQKPIRFSPAHKNPGFAELVCSNSLKAERVGSAAGLLKAEMELLGSGLVPIAKNCRVPAGGALAVDRDKFSAAVTAAVTANPRITVHAGEVRALPDTGFVLAATGPLTDGDLADDIARRTGQAGLSFFDAAAPILTAQSIDMSHAFAAARYGRGDDDYLNCPLNKEEYEAFWLALTQAERAPLAEFEQDGAAVYEGCMPVEVMAGRGQETLRFGPMKPVGLRDPATGHRPWANVQLRAENADATLYNIVGFQTNLKYGEQKRVFGMIPALAKAEYVRYGVMHRNTFLNSPALLLPTLNLKTDPRIYFGGQINGGEGYMESAATGLLAARFMARAMEGAAADLPPEDTMCGALLRYITAPNGNFQPMGANMGILPGLDTPQRDKRLRYEALAQRALASMARWVEGQN